MKSILTAAAWSLLLMQPLTATDMRPDYRVQIDVHINDPVMLCNGAWANASHVMSEAIARKLMRNNNGSWNIPGCVAVAYQLEKFGGAVQSVGMEIQSLEQNR